MAANKKKYIPNDQDRAQVKALAIYGAPHDDIASILGVSESTIQRHYKKELHESLHLANAVIAQTLYKKAKSGDSACMMFWLKTKARYREHDPRPPDKNTVNVNVKLTKKLEGVTDPIEAAKIYAEVMSSD